MARADAAFGSPALLAALRAHASGQATEEERALLQRASLQPLAGGRNNQLYLINDRDRPVCVKCYKQDGRPRDRREWQTLQLLATHDPDLAPQPLAYSPAPAPPLVAMTLLPGEPLGGQLLTRDQLTALAHALASLFAASGDYPTGDRWAVDSAPAALIHRVDTRLAGPTTYPEVEALQTLWWSWRASNDPALLLIPAVPVFAHGDGNIRNCQWDGQRLRLLDFEYSGWSDRAVELATWVEHVQSRPTPDADWDWFVAQFGLSREEWTRLTAARRLLALFWATLFAPVERGEADTEAVERFHTQIARARWLCGAGDAGRPRVGIH